MLFIKRIIDLWRDEKGNALLIGAASMPLLIGSAGLAVDTVQLSLWKRQLQRAADSAALAGAHARAQDKQAKTSAERDLQLNNKAPLSETSIAVPTSGPYAGNPNAVRVALASQRPTGFMSYFYTTPPVVRVEATAALLFNGKFCMVSLEDGPTTGVTFSGSTSLDLGCGVVSNSTSAAAVSAGGSSTIVATPIAARGGVPSSSSYIQPTTLLPYSPKLSDPLAHLPLPPTLRSSDCNRGPKINPNGSLEFEPGACYSGASINGPAHFPPGVYYINGGSGTKPNALDFGAQANVTGTGVTFILTNADPTRPPATINMNGNASLNLSAPKSGTYEGVLFYQDPRAPLNNEMHFNGTASSKFEGSFYFPRADFRFNGNNGLQTHCMQLVARRLTFSGNSKVSNTCPTDGGAKPFDGIQVKLVA
jgi:Flp pilus assembly protein TadG